MEVDLVGDLGKSIRFKLNEPDEGDDPENRYDCDDCAYPPQPDEPIILVLTGEEVTQKYCVDCAVIRLQDGE